jgi:hypothetical protein
MDKSKVEGIMIITNKMAGTRPTVGAQGPVVDWGAQGSQSRHMALRTNKLYSLRSTMLIENPLAKHMALERMNASI